MEDYNILGTSVGGCILLALEKFQFVAGKKENKGQ